MPVLRDIKYDLDLQKVFQRQGFGDTSKVRPQIKDMTTALIEETALLGLIESAVSYQVYRVAEMNPECVILNEGTKLEGSLISTRKPGADYLVVIVSTIGSRLENRVKEYTLNKETLKGMLLDGIGSVAMHTITQVACAQIYHSVTNSDGEVGATFSPGMAGFPLTEQKKLLTLAKAVEIGISLSSSGIMIPRKSTSRVMGI
jgi:hypothetical protein